MVIKEDDIRALEEKFGTKHVHVPGRKQRPRFDDEPERGQRQGKNDRRNQRKPNPSTTSIATPEIVVIKKEEKVVKTQPGATPAQPAPARATRIINGREMESCPLCGSDKPLEITPTHGDKYRPLTCKRCKDRYSGPYVEEVTAKLAAHEKTEVLSWHQWVLSQIDLARFGRELNEAFKEKERLNSLVEAKLKTEGHLPYEVFVSLRNTLQEQKLPGESMTAKAAFGKWRRLQERLKAATEVRPQVERMVAEEAIRNAPKADPIVAVAADTATKTTKRAPRKRVAKVAKAEKS